MASDIKPSNWPSSIASACIAFLVAAIALAIAVEIVRAIWLMVVIIGGVVLAASSVWRLRRRDHSDW